MDTTRQVLKGAILLTGLLTIMFMVKALTPESFGSEVWAERTPGGALLFILLGTVWTAFGMPRQLVAFGGGVSFGFVDGLVLGLVAAVIGAGFAYTFGRTVGRRLISDRVQRKMPRIARFVNKNPFGVTVLVRLLPVGSNLCMNLASGVMALPVTAFIAGSIIGYLPQTLVFALAGSGVQVDPALRIGLAIVLLGASGVMGVVLFKRYQERFNDD